MMKTTNTYIAFLRGINVGGHHKVPMADLRDEMKNLGYKNIRTILNSGNVIFDATGDPLSDNLSHYFEKRFGFSIPVVVVKSIIIQDLLRQNPFEDEVVTKDTRHYVSFLWNDQNPDLILPWHAQDHSFKILEKRGLMVMSVLDLSKSKTPKAMASLEDHYGKGMTTRNWKTIERIGKKIQ